MPTITHLLYRSYSQSQLLLPLQKGSTYSVRDEPTVSLRVVLLNSSDIPEDMRHSKMVGLRVCYFAGGIVNLYKQWFRGDLDCSLNDIAMEVSKLLQLEAQELFGD